MRLLYYKLRSIMLSNKSRRLLMRIVIESKSDPLIAEGIKASEFVARMEKSFNSGLMSINSIEELLEHYKTLKLFNKGLQQRLNIIRKSNT